jgi:hypothetical protein
MKKCSTLLAIKEMQIKMTLRFHLTLVRMAIIKKTTGPGCGSNGKPVQGLSSNPSITKRKQITKCW